MDFRRRFFERVSPLRLLVAGYLMITLVGAVLLALPVSSSSGSSQSFVDALFMASSGISTTGLVVADPGKDYTLFGQVVLLVVFQVGGTGHMAFVIILALVAGHRTSIHTQVLARESLAVPSLRVLGRFFAAVVVFTAAFELAGALILAAVWAREYGAGRALYLGVFHSVSAFCTAGFSLFTDSIMRYRDDALVNSAINVLSIVGVVHRSRSIPGLLS